MKYRLLASVALLLGFAVVLAAPSEEADRVEVCRLSADNWEQFVPQGKEVDAIYGDFVLRNRYLIAVIANPLPNRHANMTVRDIAGALIDLTTRDEASDQLSAFYPGKRAYPFRRAQAFDADGEPVKLKKAAASQGKAGAVTVYAAAAENRPAVETTYSLAAGAKHLTIVTKYINTGAKSLTVSLVDDIRADGGNEDMVKSPNGSGDLYWIQDRYWGQAYGIDSPSLAIRSNSNSRTSTLEYVGETGDSKITLAAGKSFTLTRRIVPGQNLLDVKAAAGELRGKKSQPVEFKLTDGDGRGIPNARIEIVRSGKTYGWATTDRDGKLSTSLPLGKSQVKVSALGVALGNPPLPIEVLDEEQVFTFALAGYRPGRVAARITDTSGKPIPCKVEFIAKDGTPQPNFGPVSAAFAVGNLYYSESGKFTQQLPAGKYDVIISRGPEYDAIFTELIVPPGKATELKAMLKRTVKTPGWVSADFHSHSSQSGDNTGSQLGRVLNLVCEHIEFAPCTEHNRVSTYAPHIKRLGIGKHIATVSGMELTGRPLPLNHQNVFPMKFTPHTQDGGGPVTDVDPEKQIERAALWDSRSDKFVQQNHPDIGWLFRDKDGNGEADGGYARSFPLIDAMELHPIDNSLHLGPFETLRGRRGNSRIFNWLQLHNQGFRIPGVVNTDAHYNFHGSGWLRNWIQSPTDAPARIDHMDMVHAAEQGRSIMSNGPYLEVSLREDGSQKRVTAGQDLRAASGKLRLDIRVQCPNWLDVDRVFVLVNGRKLAGHDYTRAKQANRFRDGVVRFDHTLDFTLDSDAHIVVVTGADKSTLGSVWGPRWKTAQPAAVSNPIFVDVDGGGFRANKDTLGHPLPVKFGAGKE
jgi:hypothetical protein